jgi:Family of unknown function (DUF5681)
MTSREETPEDDEDTDVGYSRPPKTTRFKKGRSGNPLGRPRGRHRQAPYEAVLGREVTIREDGIERRVTAAEAFLLQLAKRAVEGNSAAARTSLEVLDEAGKRQELDDLSPKSIVWVVVAPGSVTGALEVLRMAKKLDPYAESARIVLEPWLVEAALARLSEPLSPADQRTVVNATRTPHKVRWPGWWTDLPARP